MPPSKNLPIAKFFFRFCFMATLRKDPSISCVNLISWNFRGGGGLDPDPSPPLPPNSCIQFSKMNIEPRLYQFSILIWKKINKTYLMSNILKNPRTACIINYEITPTVTFYMSSSVQKIIEK